jgi:hypothetical protein
VTREDLELLNHPRFYKDLAMSDSSSSSSESQDEDEPDSKEPSHDQKDSKVIPPPPGKEKNQMILAIRAPPGSKIEVPPRNEYHNSCANEFPGLYSYLAKKYKINIDSRGTSS